MGLAAWLLSSCAAGYEGAALRRSERRHADLATAATSVAGRTLPEEFRALASRWKADRGASSRVADIAMHPAYQAIIGLGPSAVPLVIAELEREPDHWFWALRAITGASPVRPSSRGDLRKMAEDWIRWAKTVTTA